MIGSVERAICDMVVAGDRLETVPGGAPFTVGAIDEKGVTLLLGAGRWPARLGWPCIEGVPRFLGGRGWVRIGTTYTSSGDVDTLDGYLKGFTKVATAGWVAALLARAGVVELDRGRPARVRLRADFEA